MNLEQIDRYCDIFESRLRAGEKLSPEQFLQMQCLPPEDALVAELRRVEQEFASGAPAVAAGAAPRFDPYAPTAAAPVEDVGAVIGSYKLLQKIGEGGMGVVYMADQTEPVSRRVALKIIKPGMDSQQVIARFEAERQALALMDHPNIARVLDAGTTGGGRPYFVMELVKGVPITKYCDEKHLNPRERLELFIPICQAVQHAHQKGIIHRDIKPTNVLVAEYDDRPVPKIIDFGVAKAISHRLTERTMFTQYGQIVGTIDYMSPEQASFNQLDVDTRSDVYSLGVLLYELLTGETPFDKKRLHAAAFDELLRIIRQEEPPRPSARLSSNAALPTIAANRRIEPKKLSLLVRGELDWIVMKALEKDRSRRYETANGLAMDVQRYLGDEPVAACPPSASYRLRKLLRRYRTAVLTAGAIAVVLVFGLVGTTWQAIRATLADNNLRTQRDIARTQTAEATTNLRRAVAAEQRVTEQLWQSYLNEAHARRWSGRPGRRFESLEALRKASAIRPSMELRNEAIACMALFDIRVSRGWAGIPDTLDQFSSIFFSPDLEIYSISDSSGNITVRRVADNTEVARLPSLGMPAWTQQFSPDGRFLAINTHLQGQWFGHTSTALWRLEDGHRVFHFENRMVCRGLDFSPDSRIVAMGEREGTIGLYSTEDGTQVGRIDLGYHPWVLHFDPEGGRIAINGHSIRRVEIRDLESGAVTTTLPPELFAPDRGADDVSWHPQGDLLAVSSGPYFAIWDVAGNTVRHRVEAHSQSVTAHLAFGHTGNQLVTTSWRGDAAFWDVSSGEQLLRIPVWHQRGWGENFQFSADHEMLAYDLSPPNVRVWEMAQGEECLQLHGTGGTGVAFHPNGRLVAVSDYQGLRLWDIATSRSLAYVPLPQAQSVQFHPQGDSLQLSWTNASGRWPFHLTSTADREHWQLGPPEILLTGPCTHLSLTPDGSQLAVGKYDGTGWVIDWSDPAKRRPLSNHPGMRDATISPDGRWVATGTWKGKGVRIWNSGTGELGHELPGEMVSTIPLFTPDGQWLVTSGNEICLWRVAEWELARTMSSPAIGELRAAIAVSPDSRLLAVGTNSELKLFDLAKWEEIATFVAPDQRPFEFMSFSPDGSRLALSAFGALQVWDLRAIRARLAEMNLDWDLPGYPPAPDWSRIKPIQLTVAVVDRDSQVRQFHRRFRELIDLDNEKARGELARDFQDFLKLHAEQSEADELLRARGFDEIVASDAYARLVERALPNSAYVVRQSVWVEPVSPYWQHRGHCTALDFAEFHKQNSSAGLRPAFLCVSTSPGSAQPLFTAMWVKDKMRYHIDTALGRNDLENLRGRLSPELRLVSLEEYGVGNSKRYAALWVEQSGAAPWELHERLGLAETSDLSHVMPAKGLRPTYVNAYEGGSFTTVWVTDDQRSRLHVGLTHSELNRLLADLPRTWQPTWIDSYSGEKDRLYAIIIADAGREVRWKLSTLIPGDEFQGEFDRLLRLGWAPLMTTDSPVGPP